MTVIITLVCLVAMIGGAIWYLRYLDKKRDDEEIVFYISNNPYNIDDVISLGSTDKKYRVTKTTKDYIKVKLIK